MELTIMDKADEIVKLGNTLFELNSYIKQVETSISQLETLRKDQVGVSKDYQNLLFLVSIQREKIAACEATKLQIQKQIEILEQADNPYFSLMITKEKELQNEILNLENSKEKFALLLKTIDIYGYIKWVLSREGVVSTIIEKTFQRLEVLINRYLSAICTNGFYVTISPQKELKSGAVKDEIDVVITNKGRKVPYSSLSGGQEQRIVVSALLALYKLSRELGMNSFNFLLLDEVLDLSLADKGQQDIIRLLEGMEGEIRNIFVISHKDNLATEFPFQIIVQRGLDEITYLKEVTQ
jgi:DNA repair exonuclease SbcCD ATPase subunit